MPTSNEESAKLYREVLEKHGDKTAFKLDDVELSYRMLDEGSALVAATGSERNAGNIIPPHGANRMGRLDRLYAVAQWYPQVAVYDDLGGWDATPYLGDGEFYLEYGDFDVSVGCIFNFSAVIAGTGAVLAAGAWRIIPKPVDFSALLRQVNEALDQPLVLVVDDDYELCDTLWDLFREQNLRVQVAHDADEATERVDRQPIVAAVHGDRGEVDRVALVGELGPIDDALQPSQVTGLVGDVPVRPHRLPPRRTWPMSWSATRSPTSTGR